MNHEIISIKTFKFYNKFMVMITPLIIGALLSVRKQKKQPAAFVQKICIAAAVVLFPIFVAGTSYAVPPDTPVISSPADNSFHEGGDFISFSGYCNDTEDGVLTGENLVWVSSKNGRLGSGQNIIVNNLKSGIHTITLTATDSENLTSNKTIKITVTNNPPTAIINQPANNSTFAAGTAVTFSGTGTDMDTDDTLSYMWTATLNNTTRNIGNLPVISVSDLEVGTHVIVLTVTDNNGGTTDSIPRTVTITNKPPQASILHPKDNDSFYPGDMIHFNGYGNDPEDGQTGLTYQWFCNQHGVISDEASFTTTSLEPGYHTISLRVKDRHGAVNTVASTITIFVGNHKPVAKITSPGTGTSFNSSDTIIFKGSGTDVEDVTLSGANLVWTSSLEGNTPIGTGETFVLSNLKSGTHVITLTATDNFSTPGTGTATVVITVNNTFPVVKINSPADDSSFYENTEITFSGTAIDAEDGSLDGTSVEWISSLSGKFGTGSTFKTSTLPRGVHSITFKATDSYKATTTSSPIKVTVGNSLPEVVIISPANGNSYELGESILFTGMAVDREDILSDSDITWTSSIDGFIGKGTSFPHDGLSAGNHIITFEAFDSQGGRSIDTVTITVINSPPEVVILSPVKDSSYDSGTPLIFTGTATDKEDDDLDGASVEWSSNIDGFLGTGINLGSKVLSDGSHLITMTATDSAGKKGTDTIIIHIGNTPPVVTIKSPQPGIIHIINEGGYITFQGSATDVEDGIITGRSLVWMSSIIGDFAYGPNPAPVNSLPKGRHNIILAATDSQGAVTYSAPVTVRIGNSPPVATIISPAANAVFDDGAAISFQGSGVDPEDGVLQGNDLVWTSDRQGQIGTGNSFSLSDLESGVHVITLTVTDKDGATASSSVTIKARNAIPVPVINKPASGTSFNQGDQIVFQGTAHDREDGDLTGASLVWESDIDGLLGTGKSISTDELKDGPHTITLTATDSDGSSASASINITVVPMSLSTDRITITAGDTATVTITGGKSPYRVATRRSQIASPTVASETVSILGVGEGSTVITVTDNKKNFQEIAVTVTERPGGSVNNAPEAHAGSDLFGVRENSKVILNGRNIKDPEGKISSFLWVQTDPARPSAALAEQTVVISDPRSPSPSFITPLRDINGPTVAFSLTVTTSEGTDTDNVFINLAPNGITGFSPEVITFRSSTGKPLGAELIGGGDFSMFTAFPPEDFNGSVLPLKMIYGMFSYRLFHFYKGETAVLSIYLHEPAPNGHKWLKYIEEEDTWIDFDRELISKGKGDGAVFSEDRKTVTLYITDDGPFDDNRTDTVIEDTSCLGVLPDLPKGGGGGCFIDSLF